MGYPFGESRLETAALPTDRLYTGQREIADFDIGLYHYTARFNSPSLGRFVSADTVVPDENTPQTYNRYAYSLSNPVNYIDPTGHTAICGVNCEAELDRLWSPPLSSYGVVTANLTPLEQLAIISAVQDVGQQLADTTPWDDTPDEAFRDTFGVSADEPLTFERCPANTCLALGWTISSTSVLFNPFVYDKQRHPDDWWERTVHVVVHELGHAFNGHMTNVLGDTLSRTYSPYNQLIATQTNNAAFPNRVDNDVNLTGFAGPRFNWQQSSSGAAGEEFADMFLGWTYATWQTNPDGSLTEEGADRAGWMSARMPLWVNMAIPYEEVFP